MVFWALTQGQAAKYTAKLWFVPIPKVVLVASEKTLKQDQAVHLRTLRSSRPGVARSGRAPTGALPRFS